MLALALLPARSAFAADDLQTVLRKLDKASANFHTTSADFEFDTVTTLPIYDKDAQKGVVYYKRDQHNAQMAAHIEQINGRAVPKVVVSSGGTIKLYEKKIEQQQQELDEIRGEQSDIAWGSQIRSYVFHPYSMVKDHRTSEETGNVGAVMDGELDPFIDAYLRHQIKTE